MVKWCTFASEYNMLVLSSNYITVLFYIHATWKITHLQMTQHIAVSCLVII